MFPDSANTYDSLAETHWLLGNIDEAIKGYEKVLQLQPDNDYAQRQLTELKSTIDE
jgi:tetratricopeptide (TPR) repeat protein